MQENAMIVCYEYPNCTCDDRCKLPLPCNVLPPVHTDPSHLMNIELMDMADAQADANVWWQDWINDPDT
jgi:hypothetical protein